MILPPEAVPLITALAPAFTQPTYKRFVTLGGTPRNGKNCTGVITAFHLPSDGACTGFSML